MNTNNGIPNQGDWRGELSRKRIVNKITDDLKKHLPVSGQEGLLELQNIAQMFEDKIFTVATSQSDYLEKIYMKMLTLEIRSQGTMVTDITSSLDMLTLETESQGTMANNITSSLDMGIESQGTMANNITSSLDMLTLETESQGTMANNITSSLDMGTESQGTMANNITSSLDMGTESQGTMANNITSSLDMGTESQGTMANNITSSLDMETESLVTMVNNIRSSLDMETESQVTMANNISSNQVGPINKPPEPANERPDQGDWRGKLQPGTRERTVNKLLDILKRRLPFPGQKELRQFRKLAQRFEERLFTAATSESDYAMKIFLKSLVMETKLQNSSANNMTWYQIGPSNKLLDPANGRRNQGDWRGTLQPGARERIVNIIMDTLKKQFPIVSGQEVSDEFGKIVQSFEEGIFTAATNKADYVRKICLKTYALKTKCQDPELNIIALKLAQLMK